MIGLLIHFIIGLIVLGVVFWAVEQLLPLVPLPAPFQTVIRVLLVLLIVLVVVYYILLPLVGMAGMPRIR